MEDCSGEVMSHVVTGGLRSDKWVWLMEDYSLEVMRTVIKRYGQWKIVLVK